MFITHAHMALALLVLLFVFLIGLVLAARAGAKNTRYLAAEELNFARRSGTRAIIRRKGHAPEKVYVLTESDIAHLRMQGSED